MVINDFELIVEYNELHNYRRYRLYRYTFGEFDCKLTFYLFIVCVFEMKSLLLQSIYYR